VYKIIQTLHELLFAQISIYQDAVLL